MRFRCSGDHVVVPLSHSRCLSSRLSLSLSLTCIHPSLVSLASRSLLLLLLFTAFLLLSSLAFACWLWVRSRGATQAGVDRQIGLDWIVCCSISEKRKMLLLYFGGEVRERLSLSRHSLVSPTSRRDLRMHYPHTRTHIRESHTRHTHYTGLVCQSWVIDSLAGRRESLSLSSLVCRLSSRRSSLLILFSSHSHLFSQSLLPSS